jgi:TonB-linked SusC/RagA family outer membrane protein
MIRLYLSKCGYVLLLVLMAASLAVAQEKVVTGRVTAEDDGSPIPGVNVLEKGTSNGTVTDSDGNFRVSVGSDATLVFSFVGYANQEVAVGAQSSINVSLASDVTALSEVVVVGYGTQDKKEITGAVVTMGTKDFNKGNINDPTSLLQGKVAGLSIYNKGGDPNASPVIRLRGLSTIGSNAQPLIVVDGVLGASLDNIDPNDIESVNVLKDGSAAAIYGSRGSSGVILITTKRGSKSGLSVDYNGYIAAQTVYNNIDVMTPDEYVAAGGNDLGSRTDWQDEVTRTGVTNVHNVSIGAGSQNTTFRISTNFRDVQGILKESGWDQLNARANLTHSALDGMLNFDFNMAFTNRKYSNSFNEALRYAALYNPTAPIYNETGAYYQAILFDNFNPVAIIEQNVNEGERHNLNFGGKLDFSPIDPLTFTINYGKQYNTDTRGEYYPSTSFFRGLNRNGLARKYSNVSDFTLLEAYGTYAQQFGSADLSVSAGYSYQADNFDDTFVEMGDFPSDALGYAAFEDSRNPLTGTGGANSTNVTSGKSPTNKIIAFFGRVNLSLDNGIFLNASLRREGSSKLGPENQWGTFPALGAGVDINKFLQMDNVSLLKFRVGYGVTGSLPNSSGLSQDEWEYDYNQGVTNVRFAVNGNPDLKWEQKAETNIGVEFGVGKINGTVDLYQRKISDFILRTQVPVTEFASGFQYRNAGTIITPGLEITLNYNAVEAGKLRWTPGIVFSTYKSKLDAYIIEEQALGDFGAPGQNGTPTIRVAVGEEIGQIWGPVFAGVNETTGAPVFADLDGDGTVDANPANSLISGDFQKLGSGIPSAEAGWSNLLNYGRWDMNIFFRGAFGHSLVNQFRGFYEPIDPGAINSYNRVLTDKAVSGLTSAQYSSLYVEKASFVKLDNLTIGYNVKTGGSVKNLRLYVGGQNLLVFTNYTGIDPEPVLQDAGSVDNGGFPSTDPPNPLAPGIDRRNNYFTARTFTFGLNIGF